MKFILLVTIWLLRRTETKRLLVELEDAPKTIEIADELSTENMFRNKPGADYSGGKNSFWDREVCGRRIQEGCSTIPSTNGRTCIRRFIKGKRKRRPTRKGGRKKQPGRKSKRKGLPGICCKGCCR